MTYDEIGNPLSYRGYAMSWSNGRELAGIKGFGVDAQYQYDADGLRTRKTVNGVKTEYYYVGSQLTYEKRGDGTELYYFYDGEGKLSGLRHVKNGTATDYVAVVNSRGDVDSLYDVNGALVARYQYDGWGNTAGITNAAGETIADKNHIANVNPIRYRGYYQDAETGMYYLKSRYYDAQTHRMLNEDVLVGGNEELQSYNLFLYCGNNPVNRLDDTGYLWKWVEKSINTAKKTFNQCKTWVKGVFNGSAVAVADSAVNKVVKKIPDAKWEVDWVASAPEPGQTINSLKRTRQAVKGAKTLKTVSKTAGIVSTVLAAVDVGIDISRYEGSEMWAAIGMDVGLFALGIVIGAAATAFTGGLAVAVLAGGVVFSTFAGNKIDEVKGTFKKKW